MIFSLGLDLGLLFQVISALFLALGKKSSHALREKLTSDNFLLPPPHISANKGFPFLSIQSKTVPTFVCSVSKPGSRVTCSNFHLLPLKGPVQETSSSSCPITNFTFSQSIHYKRKLAEESLKGFETD